MASSKKALTNRELADLIYSDLDGGIKFADSTLSQDRTLALQYYYGEQPKRLHKGSSGYKSLDVFDQVETARSMIFETFVGAELPLKITPVKNKVAMAVQADLATQYVNNVLFNRNPGEDILDQVIFDALMSRIGVVRVDWAEKSRYDRQTIPGLTIEQVDLLAQDEAITEIEIEEAEDGTVTADVTMKVDISHVEVSQVRPEDFIVNTSARDIYEYAVAHRLTKRMSVWKSEGYPEDKLRLAMTEEERDQYDTEELARNDAGYGAQETNGRVNDPLITLLDAYATIDMERNGDPRLWRVLMAGTHVLEKEEVDDIPFVVYRPIRVPHIFHGASFVKAIIPTANAKTALTRSIIDHAMRTNNPRYTVLRGTFDSPRELLENKFGGIVNINKPDGVQPLPQASMNPFVFESIKMLDTDLSDTTGISRLTQGVDKDVISKQNSQGMMKDLAQASETRLRVMARRFAAGFLKELACKIYSVAVASDTSESVCKINGEDVPVKPSEWPPELDVRVSLELAPEQKDARVRHIVEMLGIIQQDPAFQQTLDYSYKRKLATEALKLRGFEDAELALSPEPPQPDPKEEQVFQLDMQMKQAEMQLQQQNAQVAMMKAETERLKAIQGLEVEERKLVMDQMFKRSQLALDERKQAANEASSLFEKQIMAQKMKEDPESVKAIAAVND
jgi:hypothetical protein